MANDQTLKEYEVKLGTFGDYTMGIDATHSGYPNGPGPHQSDVISVESLKFTNHAVGGFGRATINLVSENAEYLRNRFSLESGTGIQPDTAVEIKLKCDDEPDLNVRYQGLIAEQGMAGGTDPHRLTLECRGASSYLRKIPLFIATDNLTVNANAKLVNNFIANRHKTEYESESYVIAGADYTIPQVDFLDTAADRAIELLAKVAGQNVVWGWCAGASAVTAYPQFYFIERDPTVVILSEFIIGKNMTMAKWRLTKDRCANGVLIRCQRKLGGGDLTLWVPPGTVPEGTLEPWRIDKLRMSETVDPGEAWEYANNYLQERAPLHKDVEFALADFGKQIWPDELMNTMVRVYLTLNEDGSPGHYEDVWVDSSTVSVKGDGSISTQLRLGEDREAKLAQWLGDTYRDIQVGDISEFWSGAELAAADNDTVREWRHHAAANHYARNFWHAQVTGLECVVDAETAGTLGLKIPYFEHYADWKWDDETNGIIADGATATVYSCFIPTGRRPVTAAVYAEVGERWYKAETSGGLWDGRSVGDGFSHWSTSGSLRPVPSMFSSSYAAEAHILQELDPVVDHSPITIDVDRPRHSGSHVTTAPTTAAEMVQMPNFTDVFCAMQLHGTGDPFTPLTRYYGCRLIGITNGSAGIHVYVLLGWGYNNQGFTDGNLVFHQGFFDGTIPPMTSFYVSSSESSGSYCKFLRMVFTLPSEENNYQNYGVQIFKEDEGELLAERSGTVVPFGTGDADLWHPGAIYGGGWDQKRPYAAGMWWEDYPDQQAPSNYTKRPDPHGIRQVKLSSSALSDIRVGATSNGTTWGHGIVGELFGASSGDDPWATGPNAGKHGLHLAVELPANLTLNRLGVTFKHADEIS